MNTQQELARLRSVWAMKESIIKESTGDDMMRFIEHLAAELERKDKLLEQAREVVELLSGMHVRGFPLLERLQFTTEGRSIREKVELFLAALTEAKENNDGNT